MVSLPLLVIPAGGRAHFVTGPCATEYEVTAWLVSEGIDALEIVEGNWDALDDEVPCQE